jgi:hypothetical protein
MFALFFFVLFFVAVLTARDWYLSAKLFPLFAGIPGMVFAAIQAWREITGKDSRTETAGIQMDEQYDETIDSSIRRRRTTWFFSWLSATAVGIWAAGLPIGLSISLALWTRIEGKESWGVSLCVGTVTFLIVWGLFTKFFGLGWPPGEIFFLLGYSHLLS